MALHSPVVLSYRGNSFIKQVMEQVKKDMEENNKLKDDWDKVQKTSQKFQQASSRHEERFQAFSEKAQGATSNAKVMFTNWKGKAADRYNYTSERMSKLSEENDVLRNAKGFMRSRADSSNQVFSKTKNMLSGVLDRTDNIFSYMGDMDKKNEKLRQWRAAQAAAQEAEAARTAAAESATDQATEGSAEPEGAHATPPEEPASALVVSKVGNSSWERFGAGLRDSPFLSSIFENPLFDRVFGESEIAASIREMKERDYTFRLEEFQEDIEYVVAPHIIRTYLEGDSDALEKHCGEAAFAAVNASIKARKQQKLSLDPTILEGPSELELVTAKIMDKGPPAFVWAFNMQQVNCLRDKTGDIVEGAVDDIRTVRYAMVVNGHSEPNKPGLEYPWQISELAIVGNQPCW